MNVMHNSKTPRPRAEIARELRAVSERAGRELEALLSAGRRLREGR